MQEEVWKEKSPRSPRKWWCQRNTQVPWDLHSCRCNMLLGWSSAGFMYCLYSYTQELMLSFPLSSFILPQSCGLWFLMVLSGTWKGAAPKQKSGEMAVPYGWSHPRIQWSRYISWWPQIYIRAVWLLADSHLGQRFSTFCTLQPTYIRSKNPGPLNRWWVGGCPPEASQRVGWGGGSQQLIEACKRKTRSPVMALPVLPLWPESHIENLCSH